MGEPGKTAVIVKKSCRVLFLWIPVACLTLVFVVVLAAGIFLTPQRAERLAVSVFSTLSTGSLSLKVERFSPLSAVIIRDMVVKSGDDFDRLPLLKIKKIVFRYDFLSLLAGHLNIIEATIDEPVVILRRKQGVWNVRRIILPGRKEQDEEDEPAEKSDTLLSLPVPVKASLNFLVKNLQVQADSSEYSSSLRGVTVRLAAETGRFRTIPFSPDAVDILRKINFIVNPQETIDARYSSRDLSAHPPLHLTWGLVFDRNVKAGFSSFFKFGGTGSARYRNILLAPFDFLVSYDVSCDPKKDRLDISHVLVRCKNKTWIRLTGSVSSLSRRPFADISITESDISLTDIDHYVRSLASLSRTRAAGTLSLAPWSIRGDASDLAITGKLTARDLFVKVRENSLSLPLATIDVAGGVREGRGEVAAALRAAAFTYTVQGSRSGPNGLSLSCRAATGPGFAAFTVRDFILNFFDPRSGAAVLSLGADAGARLKPLAGNVAIRKCIVNKAPLEGMLPPRFREKVAKLAVTKPVSISGTISFGLDGTAASGGCSLAAAVPDYGLNDLSLTIAARFDTARKRFNLERTRLSSRAWDLDLAVKGMLELSGKTVSDADMNLSLKFNSPREKNVYGPWLYQGLVSMNASLKGNLSRGRSWGTLFIKGMNIKNRDSGLEVAEVACDYPFEVMFSPDMAAESLLVSGKEEIITNEFFKKKPNFFVGSVKAKHPSRDFTFQYLRDLSAVMTFENNVFTITDLRAHVMEGALYGRQIAVNLGSLDPAGSGMKNLTGRIEYRMAADVTNMNIALLDDPDRKERDRDASLSLNASFSGRGVNVNRELTATGYVNIHKIGKKFASRLMRGLSTEKGKSKLGSLGQFVMDNFMRVRGFNFTLDRGLVYTTVPLKPGIFGFIAGVENNVVSFDRLPLQEYLKKIAREE